MVVGAARRAGASRGLREAVRLRARSGVLRPPRLLDRAAPGCPRRSRTTASRARCSATAVSTRSSSTLDRSAQRSRRRRGERGEATTAKLVANVHAPTVDGRRHRAGGFRASGLHCGHQGQRQAGSLADRQRHAGVRRGRVHDQSRQGGAGLSLPGAPRHERRPRAGRSSPTAAAPTPAPVRRAADAREMARLTAAGVGCAQGARAGGVDRRHRRQPQDGRDPRRHSAGGDGARRGRRRCRRARS